MDQYDGLWISPDGRFRDMADTAGMTSPVRCRWCGGVYDLGKVTVTARYADCSMWKAPCCGVLADDRKPPWGVSHYAELPRRDRAFPVADEDADFADEWDDEDSNRFQDRVEAGLEPGDGSDHA